jgi:hypothetical protein
MLPIDLGVSWRRHVSRGHDGPGKEVLRLWREGVPTKRLAAQLGCGGDEDA